MSDEHEHEEQIGFFPMSEEQAHDYLAALAREQEGYEARKGAAEVLKDEDLVAHMASRIEQVIAEAERVKSDVLGGKKKKGKAKA